jgi:NitT/TauT family transport system permease protein/taurine transport system permease protein
MSTRATIWPRRLAIAFVVIVAWELLYRVGALNPLIFGAPSLIVAAAAKDGHAFLAAFAFTAYEIAIATAIAWAGGVAFGVVAGSGTVRGPVFAPILSAVIAVPLVVLYPVATAWLGIGAGSKIAYATAAGFFPIALSTLLGLRSIDRRYVEMARAMGANRAQILWLVVVRLALPAIVSGLRIGTSLVIISVVQGEMLASDQGLGFLITTNRALFNTGQVYLGIVLILVAAAASNFVLSALERRFGRARMLEQAMG